MAVTGSLKFNRFILYFSVFALTGILTVITAFTSDKVANVTKTYLTLI